MNSLVQAVLVGLGGILGASGRYLVGGVLSERVFALDTLVVNVLGSFVLGVLTFNGVGGSAMLVVGTGACGAFTTFSSFSVETVRLAQSGAVGLALLNGLLNLSLSIAAVGLGAILAVP